MCCVEETRIKRKVNRNQYAGCSGGSNAVTSEKCAVRELVMKKLRGFS